MSTTIDVMRSQEYTGTIQMLLQAQGGKLQGLMGSETYHGKGVKFIEQVGTTQAQRRNVRNGDTPIGSTPHDARWLKPIDWEVPADLVDDQDLDKISADPTNKYVVNQVNALRRAMDQTALGAFFGTALTGENGTTSTAFNTSRDVVSIDVGGTDSGMNVDKLAMVRQVLRKNDVDLEAEPILMLLTPEGERQLLLSANVNSFDYNTNRPLVTGSLPGYVGIEFICMNLADSAAYPETYDSFGTASERYLPAWVPSGMHMGVWQDIQGFIDVRPDKSYATQVYSRGTFASSRTEEGKVIRVSFNEEA